MPCSGEFWFTPKGGNPPVPVDLSYAPLIDRDAVVGIVGTFKNATERKLLEENDRASARLSRSLLALTWIALDQNQSLDQLFQASVEEVASALDVEMTKILELLPDGNELLLRAGVGWQPGLVGTAKVGTGGDSQAGYTLQAGKPVLVEDLFHETRFYGPRLLFAHQVKSGLSVVIGAEGQPFGVLGAHTARQRRFTPDEVDFLSGVANLLAMAVQRQQQQQQLDYSTEALQQANAELRGELGQRTQHEKQLQGYLDALEKADQLLRDQQFALDQHSIVAITNQRGDITYVNDKFCEISGYSREELIGKNHRILKSDHHTPEFFRDMWDTIVKGGVWQAEIKNRNKLGEYYWVDTTIVPFLSGRGKPYQYVAIRTDITQRKRDEEELAHARDAALEASRMKSEFLATMSHEIRTPMNGVLGMVELLLDSPLNQQQRQQAHTILDSANSLLHIINDILDFSKIEAGRLSIDDEDFALADVVESVADLLAPKARQKRLSLMTRIDTAVPDMLRGDSGRLRQILLNLAGNALKFTHSGEILVDVAVDTAHDSTTMLRFSVMDSGIGIPSEKAAQLFRPFTQADSSTTRRYGGTGLGLAICKHLVELMGGEIGLDSTEGAGSTFWFTLPMKDAVSAGTRMMRPTGTELTGACVLVVDDSQANCDVMQYYLQAWGAECVLARSAVEALAHLCEAADQARPFDLVLIDLAMPEMDGFTLAQKIQGDQRLAQNRLVMMTASDEIGKGSKALRLGFRAYFNKPVRRAHLFEGLCRVLRGDAPMLPASELEAVLVTEPVDEVGDDQVLRPGIKPVLLVEDNPVNQDVALRQLKRLGYLVRLAGNGREALEIVQQEDFAMVLMDCQMPEMDGYESTARIREWEQKQGRARMVIVAMTANAVQGDSEQCLAAGMDDYLSKPVPIEQLQQMLAKWQVQPGLLRSNARVAEVKGSVDGKVLDKLREEIGEFVGEIVDTYLSSTPALLDSLARAFAARDFDEVRIFAHTLKSSSLQLGLSRLGEMARNIEMRVRSGDSTFDASDIDQLLEEFHRSARELHGIPQPVRLPILRTNPNLAMVLVVDDDVTMRLMLRRAMEDDGYQVEEAINGAQAVSKCEALQPDIILMDCMMPVMSGFDACAMLQQQPESRRPPVLMITGLNDDVSVRRAIQCGAADFITKPLFVPILRQRVRQLLDMRRAQEHIRHLAYHDTLTGLPNRVLFNDRLQLAIAAARRNDQRLAVLFFDLDNFKKVNDSLGHAAGDTLLKLVAERVSSILREGDTLSRMGGDEFTLLLPQLAQGDEGVRGVQVLAEKIIRSLKAPFPLDGQDVYIGISIGISIYPDDSTDASGLLKNADAAMYWAKSAVSNSFCLYSTTMHEQAAERLQLESSLRKALERDELVVYYQPQMNTVSERMEGMEALLRWRHPELGLVPPNRFIPLAEETGIIVEIGTWVLRSACAQCKAWHERGYEGLTVAVNLSARQFSSGNLVEVVKAALAESGLPPQALDLEITESITIQDSHGALDTLRQLKALGVLISMDDFGTGYSSLSYLKRFPIDVLKIDQSFVRDIITDPNDAVIVETIIAMAQTLGMRVIAEGVETIEQLEFLRDKGCEVVQGYLISRPQPAELFKDLLK